MYVITYLCREFNLSKLVKGVQAVIIMAFPRDIFSTEAMYSVNHFV